MKKVLVMSAWAPPKPGGSPVYLGRLLSYFSKDSYSLLTKELESFSTEYKTGNWLPVNYYFLNYPTVLHGEHLEKSDLVVSKPTAPNMISNSNSLIRTVKKSKLFELGLFPFRIYRIVQQSRQVIKSENSEIILVTSDDGYFLISGFVLSLISKKPLYVLLFDIYSGNRLTIFKNLISNVMEGPILKHAQKVFVTNEIVKDNLNKKYGIKPVILCHSTKAFSNSAKGDLARKLILFTGNIDWPQIDNIKLLVKVVNKMDNVNLKILCPSPPDYLKSLGLNGRNVEISVSDISDIPKQISQADILYLPLSITFPKDRLIETAAPYKMAEYIASARPILVHAPTYSYLYKYASAGGFALTVSDMNEKNLRDSITKLINDEKLRRVLSKNSSDIFRKNHNIDVVGPEFASYFN